MIVHVTPTHWFIHGESVLDVKHYLRTTPTKWGRDASYGEDGGYASRSWTLGHGEADVMRLAEQGWEEGVKSLDEKLTAPPAKAHTPAWRYDAAGELPDVPRFLSGDPTHMMRHGHPKGHRPVVSMCVQIWINAGVNAQQMVNYGAAMTSLVDQIEHSGKRVELWAGCIAPHATIRGLGKRVMSATWVVKRAEEHVDLAALAFSLAHPGASRRFGWRMWERVVTPKDTHYGQGGYTPSIKDVLDPPAGMIFLPGVANNPSRCNNMSDAIAYVREQINAAANEEVLPTEWSIEL